MRFGFDISVLRIAQAGVLEYTRAILAELLRTGVQHDWTLLDVLPLNPGRPMQAAPQLFNAPNARVVRVSALQRGYVSMLPGARTGPLHTLAERVDRALDRPWELAAVGAVGLQLRAALGRTDVFHCSEQFQYVPPRGAAVLTIHDLTSLSHPEWHVTDTTTMHGGKERFAATRAAHLIADSYATKRDVEHYLQVPSERITVVYPAAGSQFHTYPPDLVQAALDRYGLQRDGYILTVGTLEPRKNHVGLINAYARLRSMLVAEGVDAPPLAITAAGERVVLGAAASVDVAEALLAVDAALKADGESLEKLFAEIKSKLTIDPRAALGALDGTGSFALTLKDPLALASDRGSQSLGLHVALGLKAPAEAQALVDVAALKLPPVARVKRNAKTRGFSLPVPDWRELHVAVVGKTLAVTTDPEFLRRVERGAAGALDKVLPTPTVPVVTTRDAVGVFFMDYLMPMGMLASRRSEYAYDPSTNQPYWRFPEVAHEKIDKVPHSPAYKAKLKEWRALDAKARKAEEARERAQTKVLLAVAGSIGALAVDLRETGDGLLLEGGQFFGPGGLARAIELAIDATGMKDNEPIWELYDKRSKAEQELQEVRARDVEKALGVQAAQ